MKAGKKKIILYSIISTLVITIVITSTVLPNNIIRSSLQEREFSVETVEVADLFSGFLDYTLKIKSDGQFLYKKFPTKIDGSSHTISFDNITNYKFYGKVVGDKFEVTFVIRMQGEKFQIKKQTFLLNLDNQRTVLLFKLFEVGGILEVTFISLSMVN